MPQEVRALLLATVAVAHADDLGHQRLRDADRYDDGAGRGVRLSAAAHDGRLAHLLRARHLLHTVQRRAHRQAARHRTTIHILFYESKDNRQSCTQEHRAATHTIDQHALIARPREIPPIIIFQLFGMFYLLWNATIVATSLFRIATGLAGGHGFVPTQRDHAGARGGTTGQLETARMSDGFLEAKVGPIAADDAANDAALETDTRREASRSRVTTVAACAPPEGHMHESAFGWNFAAPENLEPVEIISPNSRAARISPTMVGRV